MAMTIDEMISRYRIMADEIDGKKMLKVLNVKAAVRDNMVDTLKANKAQIIAHIEAKAMAEKEAAEMRDAKIKAIPGLEAIQGAMYAMQEYHKEFDRAMDNDECIYPARPNVDIDAMLKTYPQAVAYLKAEKRAYSSNFEISAIGKRALNSVIDGDWEEAMSTMEKELNDLAKEHMWD